MRALLGGRQIWSHWPWDCRERERERDREIDRMVEWTRHAFVYRGVSKNRGTPKRMVYNGKPLLKWGYPYFWKHPYSMPVCGKFQLKSFCLSVWTWHSGSYREHRNDKDQRLQFVLKQAPFTLDQMSGWVTLIERTAGKTHKKWHLLILENKMLMQPTWKQDCLLKATYVRNPSLPVNATGGWLRVLI